MGPIVDQYATYVGGTKVSRSDRAPFKEWIKNCDGANTHIQDAMTHAMRKGCLLGKWWVGADLPKATPRPDGTPLTVADDTRQPYLVNVHPANVVDFAMDGNGNATRLVIHHEVYEKPGFASKGVLRHEFHEWTAQNVTIWRSKTGSDASGVGASSEQASSGGSLTVVSPGYAIEKAQTIDHGFGMVPFALLEILEGKGIVEDVAEANKTVLNLVGLLYEELYNNTFSQTWISGADDDEQGDVKTGTSTIFFLSNPEAKVHSAGANPEQAASIINALFMEVKEIHRMAHMEQSGEPLQKRVAEAASKVEKSHESMDQLLEHIADQTQRFENRILQILAALKMPQVTKEDAISVWPKVFDTKTLREKIALAIELDGVPFAPLAAKKSLARQISMDILEDTAKDTTDANKELNAATVARSPGEVQIAKLLFEAGALGPVELYIQFRDPSATPEEARKILEQISKDREEYASTAMQQSNAAAEADAMDPSKKPPHRPEKQPSPTEQRDALEKQQAANQK